MYLHFEMGFKLQERWINLQDPAAPQFNSSCLEIDHFRETVTDSIKLGQHFYQCYSKNLIFQGGTIRIEGFFLIKNMQTPPTPFKKSSCNFLVENDEQ